MPYYSIAQGIGNYWRIQQVRRVGYISPGGSELKEVTTTSIKLKYPKSVKSLLAIWFSDQRHHQHYSWNSNN